MPSDRLKIDYTKQVLLRRYAGAMLSSGQLEAGKVYRIARFVSGDDFKNLGAPANASGAIFAATATTPTVWTKGSRLQEIKITDLKNLADETYNSATEQIILTSTSSEGGQDSGEVSFPKVLLGIALNELIAEFDPDFIPPKPRTPRVGGYTIRMGC